MLPLKILFWRFVAIDFVAVVIFGLLGLAAAKPSHTNPIAALPVVFVVGSGATGLWKLLDYRDASGSLRGFRSAGLRDIEAAMDDLHAIQGLPFLDYMEGEARKAKSGAGNTNGLAEVMTLLRSEVR